MNLKVSVLKRCKMLCARARVCVCVCVHALTRVCVVWVNAYEHVSKLMAAEPALHRNGKYCLSATNERQLLDELNISLLCVCVCVRARTHAHHAALQHYFIMIVNRSGTSKL